jgi:hypothetical protein
MSAAFTSDLVQAAAALKSIEMDGLKLFRPTEVQADALKKMAMDETSETLIVAGNRAGKSVLAAVYFAAYCRDEPITTWSGEKIHCRPPDRRGQTVNAWVVSDHLKHIGMTIYRLLMEEDVSKGLFKIIRDENTGAWRAWQPEMYPKDWSRKNDARWAPPIIPRSSMKEEPTWAMGRKKEHEFRKVKLNNNSTIYAFASSGEVKQGDPCDLIWNDENIIDKSQYNEWIMRLSDDSGKIMWSTIPRDDCFVFNEVIERCESQEEEVANGQRPPDENFSIKVELSYLDNPFIPQRSKEQSLEQMGDRQALIRIYGKRSTRLISVYQDFNPSFHVARYDDEHMNDRLTAELLKNNMVPPADWTRELILDPGTQKPAILLGAIPPPSFWDHGEPYFLCYREVFIRRALPDELAKQVMATERNYQFERFIIDNRMGRQKPPGFAVTIAEQYTAAFERNRLKCRQSGSAFIAGDDDFPRRSKQVIAALRSRPCGRPQLRIINQTCPNLVKQMNSNVRKTSPDGEALEVAADNQIDDMRVCLEYWISRNPTFRARIHTENMDEEPAQVAYERLQKEHKERQARRPQTNQVTIGAP